jgi:hypothetical protein
VKEWIVTVELSDDYYGFDIRFSATSARVEQDDHNAGRWGLILDNRLITFESVVSLTLRERGAAGQVA